MLFSFIFLVFSPLCTCTCKSLTYLFYLFSLSPSLAKYSWSSIRGFSSAKSNAIGFSYIFHTYNISTGNKEIIIIMTVLLLSHLYITLSALYIFLNSVCETRDYTLYQWRIIDPYDFELYWLYCILSTRLLLHF